MLWKVVVVEGGLNCEGVCDECFGDCLVSSNSPTVVFSHNAFEELSEIDSVDGVEFDCSLCSKICKAEWKRDSVWCRAEEHLVKYILPDMDRVHWHG